MAANPLYQIGGLGGMVAAEDRDIANEGAFARTQAQQVATADALRKLIRAKQIENVYRQHAGNRGALSDALLGEGDVEGADRVRKLGREDELVQNLNGAFSDDGTIDYSKVARAAIRNGQVGPALSFLSRQDEVDRKRDESGRQARMARDIAGTDPVMPTTRVDDEGNPFPVIPGSPGAFDELMQHADPEVRAIAGAGRRMAQGGAFRESSELLRRAGEMAGRHAEGERRREWQGNENAMNRDLRYEIADMTTAQRAQAARERIEKGIQDTAALRTARGFADMLVQNGVINPATGKPYTQQEAVQKAVGHSLKIQDNDLKPADILRFQAALYRSVMPGDEGKIPGMTQENVDRARSMAGNRPTGAAPAGGGALIPGTADLGFAPPPAPAAVPAPIAPASPTGFPAVSPGEQAQRDGRRRVILEGYLKDKNLPTKERSAYEAELNAMDARERTSRNASAPVSLPMAGTKVDRAKLQDGVVYQTPRGPARYNAKTQKMEVVR